MLIRLGYDIEFEAPAPVSVVALLHVHPSRIQDLREPDLLRIEPEIPILQYSDSFGNICSRFDAPAGYFRLTNSTSIEDSGLLDAGNVGGQETPIRDLPPDVLRFLLASRYCEVDLLGAVALDLFGHLAPGWDRVLAVCHWVNAKVEFGYHYARSTKTALDVFTERVGVCRDFQHLAITFCRCLNIPARYVTGYLGDIGVPVSETPMDFSAWFEVFMEGRWWTCDARHFHPRIGRVLMATGRDAADVALTTSFGRAWLRKFQVITDEVQPQNETAAGTSAG